VTYQQRYVDRIYTVPPATQQATPLVIPETTLGDVQVNDLSVRIPPGHRGQTGFQVQQSGTVVFPWNNSAAFLIDDDKDYDFSFDVEIDQGLSVVLFNVGVYSHSFYVRWNITPMSLLQPSNPGGLVPIVQDLTPLPVLSGTGGP
jgi:hypothetical protein